MNRHCETVRASSRRTGMTLVEMLVAVMILGLMSAGFAYILSSSQRIVGESQRMLRAAATFQAMSNVMRPDLGGVSHDGFLAIMQVEGGTPFLAFTCVGVQEPVLAGEFGHWDALGAPAAIIALGLCPNESPGATLPVLYRQHWLLRNPAWVEGYRGGGDLWRWPNGETPEMAQITGMQIDDLLAMVDLTRRKRPGMELPPVVLPVTSMEELASLWQVLAPRCVGLSVMWTDGRWDSAAHDWYGIYYVLDPVDGSVTYHTRTRYGGPGGAEISHAPYEAIWTHHDRSNWPRTVRLRFALMDPASPRELAVGGVIEYEILCNVGSRR